MRHVSRPGPRSARLVENEGAANLQRDNELGKGKDDFHVSNSAVSSELRGTLHPKVANTLFDRKKTEHWQFSKRGRQASGARGRDANLRALQRSLRLTDGEVVWYEWESASGEDPRRPSDIPSRCLT